ncbi:MAG: YtxH domain-containing protein [Rhodothermus sp.]|nr:YtxH domain-containing protein [Rhodothermus sp.]
MKKTYSTGEVIRAGLLGALLGSVAGFVVGLLIAPETGGQIRRRLTYQLEQLGERLQRLGEQLLHAPAPGEARRMGEALVANARAEAENIRQDIDALLGNLRRKRTSASS